MLITREIKYIKICKNTHWKALLLSFQMISGLSKNMQFSLRYKMFCKGLPLLQFFCSHPVGRNYYILVLGMTTLCFDHCCNPPRHTFNQILTHLWLYFLPFHLHPLPQLQYPCRCPLILSQLPLEVIPQVFNGIEVRRLCRPW